MTKTWAIVGMLFVFIAAVRAAHAAVPPIVNSMGTIANNQQLALTGTVKYVRSGAQRTRVQLLIAVPGRRALEWSLEGPTGQFYVPEGNARRILRRWDKVSIVVHPLLESVTSGEVVSVTLANLN